MSIDVALIAIGLCIIVSTVLGFICGYLCAYKDYVEKPRELRKVKVPKPREFPNTLRRF